MEHLFPNLLNQLDEFWPHTAENNPESQANLQKHKAKFNRQCQVVFDYLMTMQPLDVRTAYNGIHVGPHPSDFVYIGHLPRRIADLREKGVQLSSIQHKDGTKEWYMTETQIQYNKQKFN